MKTIHRTTITILGLGGLLLSGPVLAGDTPADCRSDAKVGDTCLIEVKKLHPTQFAVGSVAVDCKTKTIEKKHKKGKLDKYLADPKRHVPAAIGPDGGMYITDHHHLSTAIYRAGDGGWKGKDEKVHVTILENFSATGISSDEFWSIMAMQNNVWPYDENGQAVADYGKRLPGMDMGDLKDNPYRTLSRWTRESCGYIKLGKDQCVPLEAAAGAPTAPYFMEFYWARFLREQLKLDNDKLDSPKKVKEQYAKAIEATLDKGKTDAFFKGQGLNAVNYGQNQEGTYLHLEFKGDACEQWYLEAGDGE